MASNVTAYVCYICKNEYTNRKLYIAHMMQEIPDRGSYKYNCHNCSSVYRTRKLLVDHLAKFECFEGMQFDYKCKFCNRIFFQKKGLDYHTKNNVCKLIIEEDSNYANYHLRPAILRRLISVPYNPNKFTCENCKCVFKRKYLLNQHICITLDEIDEMLSHFDDTILPMSINKIKIDNSIFKNL